MISMNAKVDTIISQLPMFQKIPTYHRYCVIKGQMHFSNHKEVLGFNNFGEGVGENGEKLMNPGKLFLCFRKF